MDYYEVKFSFEKDVEQWQKDLLKDDLLSIGFDSFVDDENYFLAYCPKKDFEREKISVLVSNNNITDKTKIEINFILDQDWNSTWEETAPSVEFQDFCIVRKENNPKPSGVKYDIIINPKMSFGSANHQTTAMIINLMKDIEMKEKDVMDMGCGTAVLAILAKKMGAKYVEAIDNDDWAYNNAKENISKNNVDVNVFLGGSEKISNRKFDVFIANINLNILLDNINEYVKHIKDKGVMIMSGFYEEDIDTLTKILEKNNIYLKHKTIKDNWAAIILEKR